MAEDKKTIDLKKVVFPKGDADLLESLKKSGMSEHNTYASLVRLYVRMGLTLHRQGIHTVEQLEEKLKHPSLSSSDEAVETRIVERVLKAIGNKLSSNPYDPPA
jgi:hypothetical protein